MTVGFKTIFAKQVPTVFKVKNIAPENKRIKIFTLPIKNGAVRDLMTIPHVSEADIRHSLLKGELLKKIQAREIIIEESNIDLLQFDEGQRDFLRNAGLTLGDDGYGNIFDYVPSGYDPPENDRLGEHLASIDRAIVAMQAQLAGLKTFTSIQVTSDYTANNNDFLILVDTTSGNVTITLPDAATATYGGHFVISKNVDVFGKVTVDTAGGLIGGESSQEFNFFRDSITVYSNGTDYILT